MPAVAGLTARPVHPVSDIEPTLEQDQEAIIAGMFAPAGTAFTQFGLLAVG
jgi:hypothetical protein